MNWTGSDEQVRWHNERKMWNGVVVIVSLILVVLLSFYVSKQKLPDEPVRAAIESK